MRSCVIAMKCTKCRVRMQQGGSALCLEEGLIGVEDFVGLDKPLVFCSSECLVDFLQEGESKAIVMDRKIP